MADGGEMKNTVEAVKGILDAIPIYQDVVQPAAREVGKSLQTIAKTVHIALTPVSALVWGYEQIQDFVSKKVSEKLRNTPPSDIKSPNPNLAGPALEALKYTGHDSSLRDLYANLIASSIDAATAELAHPGFVEIIRQLTPDEAKLIKLLSTDNAFPLISIRAASKNAGAGGAVALHHFSLLGEEAKCDFPELVPGYLDNLRRLGLIEIPEFLKYTAPFAYAKLLDHPAVKRCRDEIDSSKDCKAFVERKGVALTHFGRQFIAAAVIDHGEVREAINHQA